MIDSKIRPRRILVRAPDWIGEQVISYPFFYFLRRAYPTAHIRVLCPPWTRPVQFANLVNEITVLESPAKAGPLARVRELESQAEDFRKEGPWELGFSLVSTLAASWLLFRSGCGKRRSLNEGAAQGVHLAQLYVNLLPEVARPKMDVGLFWGVPPENDLDPGVPGITGFDPEKEWPDVKPLEPPGGDYWVLAPGSVISTRRWPLERFAELVDQILRERPWPVIIVGGSAEEGMAAAIAQKVSDPQRVLDRVVPGVAVSAFSLIFAQARFTVANDSGIAHVAALCGSPLHLIWGAGNPSKSAPLGPKRSKLTLNPVECWPCESVSCDREQGALECLRLIRPERVWEEIKRGLRI